MKIQSVLGPVPPEKLGITDMHEHLIRVGGMEVLKDRDMLLNNVEKAIEEIRYFHKAGGNTIVDMDPIGCGRDINRILEVARSVPVNIVLTTGFHREKNYEPTRWWVYNYSTNKIADLLIKDITEGVEASDYNGPIVMRTEAKAGIIKAGSGYNHISKVEEKVFRAVAKAHLETGAPISTHTEKGTMALEQVEILNGEGVDPGRLVLGHMDRNPDFEYHKKSAQTGANLQYDGPSRVKYYPDSVIIDLIIKMVDAGFGKQMVLAGDMARRSYWKSYGGGPGIAYILEKFVPRLREEGLSESVIQNILVNNPRRILSF